MAVRTLNIYDSFLAFMVGNEFLVGRRCQFFVRNVNCCFVVFCCDCLLHQLNINFYKWNLSRTLFWNKVIQIYHHSLNLFCLYIGFFLKFFLQNIFNQLHPFLFTFTNILHLKENYQQFQKRADLFLQLWLLDFTVFLPNYFIYQTDNLPVNFFHFPCSSFIR